MKDALTALVKHIHYGLDQTRLFSIHNHRPYYNKNGTLSFKNMGDDNQIAKDRINKLISDCGKMKEYIEYCQTKLGQRILNQNKSTIAVLHDLCNYSKHPNPQTQRRPQSHFKPSLGKINISAEFGSKYGSHNGILSATNAERTSFWDVGERAYACIVIKAEVLNEKGVLYRELTSLIKESLKIWEKELKNNNIEIPEYTELVPIEQAKEYGQHASLYVESYEDSFIKASILTSEKRFYEASILYNYALTKSETDEQRAECYGCLGLSYEDSGELFMAYSSYITAIRYNPLKRGLHLNFGVICEKLGDKTAAKIEYQKELDLPNGDHKNAHHNLSRLQSNS